MSLIKRIGKLLLLTGLLVIAALVFHHPSSKALTGADFQAGRIIDDGVFTNSSSMSIADINTWLAAKMPACDTSGAQSISYWYDSSGGANNGRVSTQSSDGTDSYVTTSRATYGSRYDTYHGVTYAAAPYVCLKDYRENPNTHQNNLQNPGASIPGAVTPGEIIYYAAQAYHINPQVLLVTLQKEQGLVTDDWPWMTEYWAAMGYACPDTGSGCQSAYAGFTVQVNSAAWQFRDYYNNPSNYNFAAGQNNFVGYYPCSSGTTVYIQNQATADLYDYTPYQPDAGVLQYTNPTGSSSGPGSVPYADSCATYGNRNFWWYFNTWFGSTFSINGSIQMASSLTLSSSSGLYQNDDLTASYQVKNTAAYDINAGSLGICARMNGQWYDFGFTNDVIVPANGTITISYTKRLAASGSLYIYTCSYNPSFGWASGNYPYDISGTMTRSTTVTVNDSPLVTTGIALSPSAPVINQPVTATMTLTNYSKNSINIGSMIISARDPYGKNVDFPIANDVTIPGNGGTYTYSKQKTFYQPGYYSLSITNWNGSWNSNYPKSVSGSIVRTTSVDIIDNPLITSGLILGPANPSINQPITAYLSIQNTGQNDVNIGSLTIAARDPQGNNVDFPIQNDVVVPAGGTKNLTWTRSFSTPGKYSFYVAHWNGSWDSTYPHSSASWIIRSLNWPILDNPLITAGITLSPSSPAKGQVVTATVTVRNVSSTPVDIGSLVVSVRDPYGSNVDFPIENDFTIPAASGDTPGTRTYSEQQTFNSSGKYQATIVHWNGKWDSVYPQSIDSSVQRQLYFTIP